jgi:hypothetical protein
MVIVLMMATLFGQSTAAWDVGTNSARLGLKGRAVMQMMQHDLSRAVAADDVGGALRCEFQADSFAVCIFEEPEVGSTQRVATVVEYWRNGSELRRTTTRQLPTASGSYSSDGTPSPPFVTLLDELVTGPDSFVVELPSGVPYGTSGDLPPWVRISFELTADVAGVSAVQVMSKGRDLADSLDDITTW